MSGAVVVPIGSRSRQNAADLINAAQRPMIVMGHGATEAREARSIAFAEQIGAPVVTTFKGKGLIPDSHPNAAGVLGVRAHQSQAGS